MKHEILLQSVERDDPEVMRLYEPFILESNGPLAHRVDVGAEAAQGPPADLVPPAGAMLLARVDGEPAAIGGIRDLDRAVAEVKSMYVSPAHRGLGLGRRILDELHRIAAESGCGATRLDTSDYLTAAIGLYRAAGYHQVPDYNRNPKADLWFERPL